MTNHINQTTFRGPNLPLTSWREEQYSRNLLQGIIDWCNWSILDIGGYQNVSVSQMSGIYGGHMARLRPVEDPNYTDGQVWEAIRSDWIWEKGVTYSGPAPTVASGIYVNNTFYPSATTNGTYQHIINFPLGRVVFTQPIADLHSEVKTDYSYRSVSFVQSKDTWFSQLLFNSMKVERDDFLSPTGGLSHLAQARRQMPAVGVELVNRRGFVPYELGSLSQFISQDVLMYVMAENDFDRDQLIDILTAQNDKVIWLPDRARMKADPRYPVDLDYRGTPVSNPMYYPDVISNFPWLTVRVTNSTGQTMDTINNWLYRGVVRLTFQGIM